jgi:chromosome partitioning protein
MPVVALLGNKGGAGKTTLSINLATVLADYKPTVLLDADVQESSAQWYRLSDGKSAIDVIEASENLGNQISSCRDDYHHVVIDCPPSIHSEQTQQALLHSDLVLIPVLPSPLDMWASVKIEEELDKIRQKNKSLRAMMVVNQLEPRTKLSQAIRDAMAELVIPAANTAIRRRMAYKMSVLEGKGVTQLGVRGREASNELHQLIEELDLLS